MLKYIEKLSVVILYVLLGLGLSLAVLLSARTYSNAEKMASAGASARVSDQYLRMKLRQGDVSGALRVEDGVVYITEAYPEGVFEDVLYLYDGMLSEQLVGQGVGVCESMGDAILPCDRFHAGINEPWLVYDIEINGIQHHGYILIRSTDRMEVAP